MKKAVESLRAGHPDKVCDQIADAIVDEYVRRDPHARVDIKVMGSHGMLMIGGEVVSLADFDVAALAKNVYKEIGYTDELEVFANIEPSSDEMKQMQQGCADTLIVNGYATAETTERLPTPLVLAHAVSRRLDDLYKTDPAFAWLRPDGKVQVVMEKGRVHAITILASHTPDIQTRDVQTALLERVVAPLVGDDGAQIFINPIGSFTTAGFSAFTGTSGRRMGSDTYGGLVPHGDGLPFGKDPMRADRAGAYLARSAARYLVDQGLASSALVQAVYTMGRREPVHVHAVGMGEKSRGAKMDLTNLVKQQFDFRPEAIVQRFDLLRPLYRATSVYGQFGRAGFPWEEEAVA